MRGFPVSFGDPRLGGARRLARGIGGTVVTARLLASLGCRLDLSGLDGQVALLCAKALDLPPEVGRMLRTDLVALLEATDALAGTLAAARQVVQAGRFSAM